MAKVTDINKFRLKMQEPSEFQQQVALVQWLRLKGIRFTASANGSKRDVVTAVNLKRQGVSPGWPDIFIPYMRKGYGGLLIELKRVSGGVTSPQQSDWLQFLTEQGYKACLAYGAEHAMEIIEEYFQEKVSF